MIRRPLPWLFGLGVLSGACTGIIGGDNNNPDGTTNPAAFKCDAEATPAAIPLRRLSYVQYRNTIHDIVRFAAPNAAAPTIEAVNPILDQLPTDQRIGPDKHYAGFSRRDQSLQQEHVDGLYAVGAAVGSALTKSSTELGELAGTCATDADATNDDGCLDGMIRRIGERALRRPVSDADVAFYRAPAGTAPFDAADYADVVALLLNAPHLMYFVEHGEDGTDESVPLDGYEVASRLSYHFWQTLPDAELFASAKSGEILTDAGFDAQLQRVFKDPRTRDAVAEFFGQWLENSTLEELDSRAGTPLFDAFSGMTPVGPDLREAMLQEVTDAALYYTFDAPGGFRDLLLDRHSFAKSPELAGIYGVSPWNGGEPPMMSENERVGLLTRAAYLSTGSANTRPIMKGVFIRKALLCDDIPAPPPNAAANPPQLSDTASTREVVEELTGDGACASCHSITINPLGFATENFDSLGRVRQEQTLFDIATGMVVGTAPVDTSSVPRIDTSDETASKGASDVMKLIADSPKPYACFARQYFRYTFGRQEDTKRDGCALADMKLALDASKPMSEVLVAIAKSKAFRSRSFAE
jgi:Protein of unknown function (DUF1592)/Protein of unknown function (DUF1588)/Protein of unknown function (DUF1585)